MSAMQKRALKRARPVHSCIPCRNKKLKCDRRTPCEMCVKAERPEHCFYDAKIGSMSRADGTEDDSRPSQVRRLDGAVDVTDAHDPATPPSLKEGRTGVIEDLQIRVDKLESLLATSEHADQYALQRHIASTEEWIPGSVEFKDGRSKFRPLGHKSAILYRFTDAKTFIGQKVNNPTVVKTLRSLRKQFPKQPRLIDQSSRHGIGPSVLPRIFDLIPPKQDCDLLINSYFEEGQSLLSILDRRKFALQYDAFWALAPQSRAQSSFVPCLLLVTSIASLLTTQTRTTSLRLVCDLVEDWLYGIAGKELSDLLILQTETLLVYAMQCSGIISEQVYRTSGRLVRSALIAGLQYDPGSSSQISEDEINARRHLWNAIAELDLQASLICGLPSALGADDFTCRRADDHGELGPVLGDTLAMRLEGGRLSRLKPGERSRAISCIKTLQTAQSTEGLRSSALSKAFFDIFCHRSIVSFARPLLEGHTLAFVRLACCRTSMKIMDHLEALKSKPEEWTFFFAVCNQDIFQAMLIMCLNVRVSTLEKSISPPAPIGASAYTVMPEAEDISKKAQKGLQTLLTNISDEHMGEYIKDLIVLAVVRGSADNPLDNTMQHMAMDEAFQQVLEALTERTKASNELSPTDSGHTSGTQSDSLLDFDNPAWLAGANFNFDFGAPLDQNFGFEHGILEPGLDLQWANF